MLFHYLFVLIVYSIFTPSPTNGWETPSSNQYHIQTDEGPERYFRYQTDSGQYRKEKRLEDGTVVGTYAWIDDNGFLLQRDYIADNAGYRILKTKNVYVGRNVPVGDAVKAAKKYPASAGTLVKSNQRPVVTVPYKASLPSNYGPTTSPYTTPAPILSTTAKPYVDISSNSIVSTTPTAAPVVEITPHSAGFTPTVTQSYLPSTPSPFSYSTSRPSTGYTSIPPTVQYVPTTGPDYETLPPLYNIPKEIDNNGLEYNPYVRQSNNNFRFQNGPTYPLDQNGRTYNGQNIGNGYDPQYSTYDGVSVTNDGFRYYIPRAYHEEQTLPGNRRDGSFGYIDPFGIRRVIYYNTAPGTGFQHKKNNRYVGFNATPYDPRPY